jgi:hypothetical protein
MRPVIQWLIFLAAICTMAPASAELYKWVDERGVTNYSNEPPPASPTANKVTRVGNKISVYTPDESFMQAVKAVREQSIKKLTEPEPERSPVARIGPPQQSGYEQCLASGRMGCEDLYNTYYPLYATGAAVLPWRGVRPTRFLPPLPTPLPVNPTRVSRGPPAR